MTGLPDNPSESFKRRNAHIYGVRAVETSQPESASPQTLVRHDAPPQGRAQSVALCISLVVLGRRTLDSDNLQGACKSLRDAIAESLGIDDGDSRITWEYGQQKTAGRQGVVVKIEAA